jgi:hypothetical protein
MGARVRKKLFMGLAIAALMLVAGPAAQAFASAQVRFVNARGGSTLSLTVSAGGQRTGGGSGVGFGQVGALMSVPAGAAQLSVGGTTVTRQLSDGTSYTVAALPKNRLLVLRNGSATGKVARIRVVHAAPELGTPDIRLGRRTIAQGVKFRSATGYLTVSPGSYTLAVTKPSGGAAVVSTRVSLAAGTATTAVVAGSAGSPARIVVVNDNTFTPAGAPHTGLGGLARHGAAPWALALLAALVAGTLGGAMQLGRVRRSRL